MNYQAMIKLVAFDLDGTIGNTIPMCIKAFREAVKPYAGNELSEKDVLQTFGLNEEGMIRQVVAHDWEKALDDFYVIYEQMHTICPTPFDGIMGWLEELKEKSIHVALITGKGKKSCAITLKIFGLETYFDRIETGSAQKNRKAEAMTNLLMSYHLQPGEMVYIGDDVSDIAACREAGLPCFSAAWGATPANAVKLERENQGNVFYSIQALRDFLNERICPA